MTTPIRCHRFFSTILRTVHADGSKFFYDSGKHQALDRIKEIKIVPGHLGCRQLKVTHICGYQFTVKQPDRGFFLVDGEGNDYLDGIDCTSWMDAIRLINNL